MMTDAEKFDAPAVAGAEPAKKTPYGSVGNRYGEEEMKEIVETLEQGTLFYAQGRKVRRLEEEFASYCGSEFAVACSSGTAAIHSALIAAGISPGDEVIVSPITDMGTLIPILYQGAIPVFADLHPHTYDLLPESAEERITDRTRAIIAVHLAGNACDLNALSDLCEKRGIVLVEDCAQAHGCRYEGSIVGMKGDYGCFSLNEFKHISCGDGGIVVSKNPENASRLRLATDKAYNRNSGVAERNPIFLANNYRMTELEGAVALAQLRKLEDIVSRRRKWCAGLSERRKGTPGIALPEITPRCDPSWWFYLLRAVPDELHASTDEFVDALKKERISIGAHYIGKCVYEFPIFRDHSAFARGTHPYMSRDYAHGLCPNAEAILDTCLMIVVNEGFTETDMEETARGIIRTAKWFAERRAS